MNNFTSNCWKWRNSLTNGRSLNHWLAISCRFWTIRSQSIFPTIFMTSMAPVCSKFKISIPHENRPKLRSSKSSPNRLFCNSAVFSRSNWPSTSIPAMRSCGRFGKMQCWTSRFWSWAIILINRARQFWLPLVSWILWNMEEISIRMWQFTIRTFRNWNERKAMWYSVRQTLSS